MSRSDTVVPTRARMDARTPAPIVVGAKNSRRISDADLSPLRSRNRRNSGPDFFVHLSSLRPVKRP